MFQKTTFAVTEKGRSRKKMCKYQLIKEEGKMPECEFTKSLCTLCVLGNAKTYKEAEEAERKEQE